MKNSDTAKRMGFIVLVLFFFSFCFSDSAAQTYKKGIVVEEWTGDWCGYCPRGAWAMDSMQRVFGDIAVLVSWHNGSDDEPMRNPTSDTITSWFPPGGYPWAITHRLWSTNGIGFYPSDGPSGLIRQMAKDEPLVDFRVVNVAYNPATREIQFDLDMTPYPKNASKLPASDTANYITAAIITEDGLVYDQVNYGLGGLPNPIEGFIHNNVGRKAIGKVLGDNFPYSTTASTQALPARKHYSYTVPADWNHNNLRVKVFVAARHPKTQNPNRTMVFDAKQTGYLTALPTVSGNMVYVVTPNGGGAQPQGPIKLYFGKGGSVDNVKLEYSEDGGTNWTTIVASTATSPYEWTPPSELEEKDITVRASWVSNANVKSVTEEFSIAPTPKGFIFVTKPLENDVVKAGEETTISFSASTNPPVTTNKKIEYTLNYSAGAGATWTTIVDITTPVNQYNWMVPDSLESADAVIRITDQTPDKPVVGESGVFKIEKTIAPNPTFKSFSLTGATGGNIPFDQTVQFKWEMENGVLDGPYDIQMSTNKNDWAGADVIVASIPKTATNVNWTVPSGEYMPQVYFRITDNTGENGHWFLANGGAAFSIGTQGAVKNNGGMPTSFALSTNYPNPFGSVTNIDFDVPERSFVTIIVRNELGQEIARLADGMLDAGSYTADFDASNLPAGLYTYTLESGATKLTGKMSIVR